MASATYDAVNKAWKSTCKVLLGEEVGELDDFADWLSEYLYPARYEKSAISKKELRVGNNEYASGSKFLSYNEIDFSKKFTPLSINQIKDIDSIVESVQENWQYTADVVLGNSKYVEKSTHVTNGNFIYNCTHMVSDSKYIAYSVQVEKSSNIFGALGSRMCDFSIRTMGGQVLRSFECPSVEAISDCYFCASVRNCKDCFFSFGADNGSFLIGNLALPREKYLPLKKKLLSEIAQKLRKDKRIFSIYEILSRAKKYGGASKSGFPHVPEEKFDIAPIEQGFSKTASLVLGKPLHGMRDYEKYLQRHVPKNVYMPSPLSNATVIIAGYRAHLADLYGVDGRMLPEEEVRHIGRQGMPQAAVDKIRLDPEVLAELLASVAYSDLNKRYGKIDNVGNGSVVMDSRDCYEGSAYIFSKQCAYCFWPLNSEHIFGSYCTFQSSFCLKSHFSERIARCLEVDGCKDSTGLYYSHNLENCTDSMFCFNVKNKKYAIGNVEYPREEYLKIKQKILSQIADELEKTHSLKYDIYNIGCKK